MKLKLSVSLLARISLRESLWSLHLLHDFDAHLDIGYFFARDSRRTSKSDWLHNSFDGIPVCPLCVFAMGVADIHRDS